MLISKIVIGDRVRKDMGDLRELADSIAQHGLLHPVVVTRDNVLVAGHRRIEAMKLLGALDIEATVVDVADPLGAERDENAVRKDFTPTEAVAIGRLIEQQHRARVEATRSELGRKGTAIREARRSGDTSSVNQLPGAVGATRETAARAVGMGAQKYTQAKAVVVAAESAPEKFGDLPALMDETGNVSGAHREMERRRSGAPPPTRSPREGYRQRVANNEDDLRRFHEARKRNEQTTEDERAQALGELRGWLERYQATPGLRLVRAGVRAALKKGTTR